MACMSVSYVRAVLHLVRHFGGTQISSWDRLPCLTATVLSLIAVIPTPKLVWLVWMTHLACFAAVAS